MPSTGQAWQIHRDGNCQEVCEDRPNTPMLLLEPHTALAVTPMEEMMGLLGA